MNHANQDPTVAALFYDRTQIRPALQALQDAGFPQNSVGVLIPEPHPQEMAPLDPPAEASVAPGGAATGAVSGAVAGGLTGLVVGLGALAIPGLGPLIAGGVLGTSFAGLGAGAVSGGLIGGLMGLGVPNEDAKHFEEGLRQGAALVTVHGGDQAHAAKVLKEYGGAVAPSSAVEMLTHSED